MIDGGTLNKVLPALVLPTGLALWLCLAGVWKRKLWPVAVAMAVLAVAGCQVVSDALLEGLERPYVGTGRGAGGFEAVYVLGGYLEQYQGEELEPQWNDAGDRLETGMRMVMTGRAGVLVLSAGDKGEARPEGARAKAVALERGLRTEQVVVTGWVENTADEARSIAAAMKERGWTRVALVTSAFHMRRAMMLMEQAGAKMTPVATDFHGVGRRRRSWDYLPSGEGLKWSEKALRERLGMGFYWLKGALG